MLFEDNKKANVAENVVPFIIKAKDLKAVTFNYLLGKLLILLWNAFFFPTNFECFYTQYTKAMLQAHGKTWELVAY